MEILFKNSMEKGSVISIFIKNNRYVAVSPQTGAIADITDRLDNQTRVDIKHIGRALGVCISGEKMSICTFAQLHTHSEYSMLDGISKLTDIASKSSGVTAITDHGNMFAALLWQEAMYKEGKRAVFGFEAYAESIDGEKGKYHLILLAKNETGLKNIMKLTSKSYGNMYYKPHVSLSDIREYHEGIVCTSACLGGEIARKIEKEYDEAKRVAEIYKKIFGSDYYLEIQRHGIEKESYINSQIIKLARELKIKLVAANDSHYINEGDKLPQEIALCVAEGKQLDEPHFKFDGTDYYYMTDSEMINKFWDIPEAIESTLEIAEKCNVSISTGTYYLPKFPVPNGYKDETEYFLHLVQEGYQERFKNTSKLNSSEYLERLNYEEKVIIKMGFPAYFLIVWEYVDYARENNILVGPGRGSAAGSLVSYCLRITDLDPIEYGLLFERFLNPDRISMPDIDMDFEYRNRAKVIDHAKEVYGEACVCNISTFSTLRAKAAIKDCARVCGKSELGNKISKMIGPKEGSIAEAIQHSIELANLIKNDQDAAMVIDLALKLEGNVRQPSTNACGVVISADPIVNYVPTALMESSDEDYNNGEKFLTTQADKNVVEKLGLLKMDFLGLRTLTVIQEGLKYANEDRNRQGLQEFANYREISCFDPYVYQEIGEGKSHAVFQIESFGMRTFMRDLFADVKIKIQNLENKYNCRGFKEYARYENATENDSYQKEMEILGQELFKRLVAGVSLYRPGPRDYIPDYIKNMKDPEHIKYDIPQLEPVLRETYGIIVYQEQVMKIVRLLAGFSSGQSDTIRKSMGKKIKAILDEYKPYFIYGSGDKIDTHTGKPFGIKGCIANGISEQDAIKLWDKMEHFAEYAFNKSHAAVYSVITATCAYLKHYHPAGYMCAMINAYIDTNKAKGYISAAEKMGIRILQPDVNNSANYFRLENGCIRYGFAGIKGINKIAKLIEEEKCKNGEFKGVQDFCNRMYVHKVSKKNIEALTYVGCFDCFGKTRRSIQESIDKLMDSAKKNAAFGAGQLNFFDVLLIDGEMTNDDFIPDVDEYTKDILLDKEYEIAGMYITEHPLDRYQEVIEKNNISEISLLGDQDLRMRVMLCGLIKNVSTRVTKKDGRTMATFSLEDKSGSLECVIYPDDYAQFGSLINTKAIRIVTGRYKYGDFGYQLVCSSIKDIEGLEKSDHQKNIYVNIRNEKELDKLLKIAEEHPGRNYIFFQLKNRVYRLKKMVTEGSSIFLILQDEFGTENVIYK